MAVTTIRIKTDKNGKPIAHYWGLARRWLPISIDEAWLKLATQPERYKLQNYPPFARPQWEA